MEPTLTELLFDWEMRVDEFPDYGSDWHPKGDGKKARQTNYFLRNVLPTGFRSIRVCERRNHWAVAWSNAPAHPTGGDAKSAQRLYSRRFATAEEAKSTSIRVLLFGEHLD